MVATTALFIASLFSLVLSKPSARGLQVHEFRESAPSGFVRKSDAPSDAQIKLRIALTQNNPDGLIDALYAVSTPNSPSYGEHLSKDDVSTFVAPAAETVKAVNAWLEETGLTAQKASPSGDWITVTVPISKANELLDANYGIFTEEATGKESIRTLSYSIPTALKSHIDNVHPTISFSRHTLKLPLISAPVRRNLSFAAVPSSCSGAITPACIQSLYGIPTTAATESSNQLGVTGYIEEYANSADLKTFLKKYRPDISSSTTFTLQTLDGGSNPQSSSEAGVEANLDVQYTIGLATGVPTLFISVGENNNDDLSGFYDTISALLDEDAPPQVLTTSYGENESDISRSLANTLCNAYAQLGARGVSILFASGDGGVAGSQSASCSSFVPTFPSGCPYMTSVGATGLSSSGTESGSSFSSGGFSNYFGIPDYQSSAVSTYLSALGSTNSGKFNKTGRGFPDVAAVGESFEIVVGGSVEAVDGTSCASPTFASVVALLNDGLIAAGKSPLGFLNPFLYSTGADALNDITSGDNPGCSTNGFPAKSGWDPITGLGTPDFAALQTAVGL